MTQLKNQKPKIAVLYCQHSINKEADIAAVVNQSKSFHIKPSMMACSSKIQLPQILQILDKEADGLEIIACSEKSCRFLVGKCRAEKRINYARQLLDRIQVGADRLGITYGSGMSAEELTQIAQQRGNAVKAILDEGDSQ